MAYVNFPVVDWSYSLIKIPLFDTKIINYGNKVEQRIANVSVPRYKIKGKFSNFTDETADAVMAFFEARKGAFEAFYLQNQEEAYRKALWQATHAYIVGNIVRPVTANGRSYKCTIAGTSGGTEPTWPTTPNGTVVDGAVTWKENTYLVRFEVDYINLEYFQYSLYDLGEITFIEVNT